MYKLREKTFLVIFIGLNFLASAQENEFDNQAYIDSTAYNFFEHGLRLFAAKPDSAILCFSESFKLFETAQNWEQAVNSQTAISTTYFKKKGDYKNSIRHGEKALSIAKKHLHDKSEAYANALNNIASNKYTLRGAFREAIPYYQKVLAIDKMHGQKFLIASSLNNIGNQFQALGDFDEAIKYFKEGRQYQIDSVGLSWRSATTSVLIGNCFKAKNELEEALFWYQEALNILSINLEDKKIVEPYVGALRNMAEIYLEKKDWSKVEELIKKAQQISQKIYILNRGKEDDILAELFIRQQNNKSALAHLNRSKKLAIEEFKDVEQHPLIAEKDIQLAIFFQKRQDWESALFHYQEALIMLSKNFEKINVYRNPSLEQIYAKPEALKALKGKARVFYSLFKHKKNKKDLLAAFETFTFAIDLIKNIRQGFLAEGSKQFLLTTVQSVFEDAIEVTLSLHKLTKDNLYLEKAFNFSERNKAILLLESINENTAKGYAGIPDSLLKKEKEWNVDIAFLQRIINEEKQKGKRADLNKIKIYQRDLFESQQNYNQLIKQFEKEIPAYYELKYNTQLATVGDIQKKLKKEKSVLIEYFFGEKNIYIFTISSNDLNVNKSPNIPEILAAIKKTRQIISQPPSFEKGQDDFNTFAENASFLFEELIDPALLETTNNLIIVPADHLCYLPFEILLKKQPVKISPDYSLENLDYLVENYEIQYSYSATLFLQNLKKVSQKPTYAFIGFAPSFQSIASTESRACVEEELYSLNCSENEVTQIQQLLGGKTLLNLAASKSSFEKFATNCSVLHLATHACIDNKNPAFNKIYLTDDYLFNSDLYNFQFQAEMTVLSACNTGSGKLVKGEGVMSLSRGFIHAGCKSVVMSLWSVDDCATSDIMINFYSHLKEGKSKSKSIRQAKIDFISSAKSIQKHPYYWAAFVQFGNANPIKFSQKNRWISPMFFTVILMIVLIIYFLLKYR